MDIINQNLHMEINGWISWGVGDKWEITINKNYRIAGMKPCH